MIINDILYGQAEIDQPVLIELLKAPELQRLHQVGMGGYYPGSPYASGHRDYTRYRHSVGVMLLLRRFNAPLEEQIAGLIHDVSHSAFSHTIDYILREAEGEKTQNCQDRLHDDFVRRSSLAAIITRHGFNLDRILDESRFPLKENQLPDICADRIDYCLRAGVLSGDLTLEDKDVILDRLVIHNGSFVFDNLNAAIKFSRLFYHLNHNMWSGFASAVQFCVSALMFRRAIDLSLLKLEDFYNRGDAEIIQTIEASGLQDKELAGYYQMLQNPPEYFCDNAEPYLDRIFCKSRTVDPLVITASPKPQRVSELDSPYAALIANQPKFKEYRIGIRNN